MRADVEEAFDEFVRAHYRRLLGTAIAITGSRADAEDLVHDVLSRLMTKWMLVEGSNEPYAYVRRALLRRHLDTARGRRRERAREHLVSVRDVAVHDPTPGADTDSVVRHLQQLPPRQRAVIVLRYVEDLDDTSIAAQLGITKSTVRVTARNALRSLQQLAVPATDVKEQT